MAAYAAQAMRPRTNWASSTPPATGRDVSRDRARAIDRPERIRPASRHHVRAPRRPARHRGHLQRLRGAAAAPRRHRRVHQHRRAEQPHDLQRLRRRLDQHTQTERRRHGVDDQPGGHAQCGEHAGPSAAEHPVGHHEQQVKAGTRPSRAPGWSGCSPSRRAATAPTCMGKPPPPAYYPGSWPAAPSGRSSSPTDAPRQPDAVRPHHRRERRAPPAAPPLILHPTYRERGKRRLATGRPAPLRKTSQVVP